MKNSIKRVAKTPWFIIAVISVVVCLAGVIVAVVILSRSAPLSGAGTEDDPYLIGSAEELEKFSDYIDAESRSGEHFLLTSDINLGGAEWSPVAANSCFNGVFDGGGHTVSNFTIASYGSRIGFFANIGGGENAGVYNLILNNVAIDTATDAYAVGVIAAYADARIENCKVIADVSLGGHTAYVGGITGYAGNTVTGCESGGRMTIAADERLNGSNSTYEWPYYAGICGYAGADVTYCINRMGIDMSRTASGGAVKRNIQTGGICGNACGKQYIGLENYADICGVGAVGGIIGGLSSSGAVVSSCFNYGNLSSSSDILCDIGGIVARSYTDGETLPRVENCYNRGNITLLSLLNGTPAGGYEIEVCWVGGIVGAGNINIACCASECDINVSGYGTHYVGGVAGGITGVLKDSYHIGDVTVQSASSIIAGGVLGVLQSHEYYNGNVDNLVITIERCYNVGEVNIRLEDNPLSAAANYLAGGVVGYNMQQQNVIRNNYFDQTVRDNAHIPEGYTGYIYWYGEENSGQAENIESVTISGNDGLTSEELKSGLPDGFGEYGSVTDNAVWVSADGCYPKLWWQD